MPQICLYLQLHQPWRLSGFDVFDLGSEQEYFSGLQAANKEIFQKVARKSYLPMLQLLLQLVEREPKFVCAVSCSGVFLEQAIAFQPEVITILQQLTATKKVEILAETYYHSLAALYSPAEFKAQVGRHQQLVLKLFKVKPTVFRNTELIYSNDIAEQVAELGYQGMLTEAVPRYLWDRPKTRVYYSYSPARLPLLLKHAELSDDVAFRFGERTWQWYPLTVARYLDWMEVYGENEVVNLFMDFETFGEHQWAETGIFEFFAEFVHSFAQKDWNTFATPSQVFKKVAQEHQYDQRTKWSKKSLPIADELLYDVPDPISWADVDRDLTAWRGNELQLDTLQKVYSLQEAVYQSGNAQIMDNWRRLQTSDHFYYMCTKWAADGDVHAYFSPFDSPYEAYRQFCVVLADLEDSLHSRQSATAIIR